MRWPWRHHERDHRLEELYTQAECQLAEQRAAAKQVEETIRRARAAKVEVDRFAEAIRASLRGGNGAAPHRG
jgi:hypothetical protein